MVFYQSSFIIIDNITAQLDTRLDLCELDRTTISCLILLLTIVDYCVM